MITELGLLTAVKLANTGKMLWDVVGPLLQQSMENNRPTILISDLKQKSDDLGEDIEELDFELAEKEARDALKG